MNAPRKRRLIFVIVITCSVTLAAVLALYALKQNLNLFYSPSQLVLDKVSQDHSLRLGGLVQEGSIRHANNGLLVTFLVTDHKKSITVRYTGVLPDLFRAGQMVVVEGKLNSQGVMIADQVLAKHDERYMPAAVRNILQKAPA